MLGIMTEPATIDPTALALLSIFGGAALAALAGLFGAWLQGRREHAKWVREKRYEAILAMEVQTNRIQTANAAQKAHLDAGGEGLGAEARRKYIEVADKMAEAVAPLAVLGPDEVSRAADAVWRALDDPPSVPTAQKAYISAARKALRVGR